MSFYNPYAFIPVTGKPTGTTPFEDSNEDAKDGIKQGHHRYIRHDHGQKMPIQGVSFVP